MDEREAWARLAAAEHAVLATVSPAGTPHVVPVVFAVDARRIVTAVDQKPKRSRRLQRLRHIAANPAVSVLVDRYDEDWRRLWWVRADGRAHIVSDGDELATVIAALTARYPQYSADPPRGPAIVIDVDRITGWAAGDG